MSHTSDSHCSICQQKLKDLKLYTAHPEGAVDEKLALTDDLLRLIDGNEHGLVANDKRATNKLTHFSVYCKNGHLCPLDGNLIQKGVHLFASGYVKAIYEENDSTDGGVPCIDIGPIVEWFITGFDTDDKVAIVLSTPLGEYYLMESSKDYEPFMVSVRKKTFISKTVIAYLMDEPLAEYEDLLNKFKSIEAPELPKFEEKILIDNGQFIHDQVKSIDKYAQPGVPILINAPCISVLVEKSNSHFNNNHCLTNGNSEEKRNDL